MLTGIMQEIGPNDSLIERLTLLPDELKRLPNWLVWKFEPNQAGKKPRKVPYYVEGRRRHGTQGSPEDRGSLTSFSSALQALESGRWAGLGLAMMPEAGLVGIDLDDCIVNGRIDPQRAPLLAGTYSETSPSGNGIRAFFIGDYKDRKHLTIGVEIFHAKGFLTVTGQRLNDNGIIRIPEAVKAHLDALFNSQRTGKAFAERMHVTEKEDPVYGKLCELNMVRKKFSDGRIGILCPFADQHTTGDSDADCVYFLANTNGYKHGTFHCFHAHCAERPQANFLEKIGINQRVCISSAWGEPQPLVCQTPAAAYPLDALPEKVRQAVEEVHAFVKAPVGLVVASALSALSLVIQGHVDVERAKKLTGPVSLFLISIAESGERKTQIDRLFMEPIERYVKRQNKDAKSALKTWEAQKKNWAAKQGALHEQIKRLTKGHKPTEKLEKQMIELQQEEPLAPRWPRILLKDDTPEKLAQTLANLWPSAGVISSEAGIVFGAHGMNPDSVMRNLAQFNILWDGGILDIGRKVAESIHVAGARLTLGLQVQEPTLRAFFDRTQGLARGTGFLARFLVSWPESTIGTRIFTEPSNSWPALTAFNDRIIELLNLPLPIDEKNFTLEPRVLSLSPETKTAWILFHNTIEKALGYGGELFGIRDVAAKSADNAARIAGLFHTFTNGPQGSISIEDFESAVQIVSWHLNECLRFFGEIALPTQLSNAACLDAWLILHCQQNKTNEVSTRTILQFGPSRLRSKTTIEAAIQELCELDRARQVKDGNRKIIQVNPSLLGGTACS